MPRTKKTNVVEPPTAERVERPLFPYQLETVELMEIAERIQYITNPITGFCRATSAGILKNQVGSGKTATVLKLIKNHLRPFDKADKITLFDHHNVSSTGNPQNLFSDPITGEPLISLDNARCRVRQFHLVPTTLVVCPKTIVNQWKREAEHMLLDCMVIDSPKHVNLEELTQSLTLFREKVGDRGSIVVVSAHLFKNFIDVLCYNSPLFQRERGNVTPFLFFHRLVFDDIHSVTKWTNPWYNYSAPFLWFVNSTFDLIGDARLNTISQRTFLFPSSTRDTMAVINVTVPETTYTLPPINENRVFYRNRTIARRLEEHLPEPVRRMLETGDFTGAYASMTGLRADESGHLTIPISARKPIHVLLEQGYKDELNDLDQRKQRLIIFGHSTEGVDRKIQEVQRQLESLRERIKEFGSEMLDCPICLEETDRKQRAVVKCCNNVFCKACIGTTVLRNGTCPLCRERVGMDCLYSMDEEGRLIDLDYQTLTAGTSSEAPGRQASTPMEALRNIIRTKPEGRFVVFAPTERSSITYRNYFRGSDISFADMGGSAASIRKHLESFESGGLQVLFMSSSTSNAGLNLQNATDVVVIGDNDGQMVEQAIGRVRRFPRTEPVPVHYILSV